MDSVEKVRLLKSLRLLERASASQLEDLAGHLGLHLLEEQAVVFKEGAPGDSIYFLASGAVRISKELADGASKELAVLRSGDCFGEMSLTEDIKRSATATVVAPSVLFRLGRAEMGAWLKSKPEFALEFFNNLATVQSRRLRRTSSELAMLFGLCPLLLDPPPTAAALLKGVLDHVERYLDGPWTLAADRLDQKSGAMVRAASKGPDKPPLKVPPNNGSTGWVDVHLLRVYLDGKNGERACLSCRHPTGLPSLERDELTRALSAAGGLMAIALDKAA